MMDSEIVPRSELERVFQDTISFRDEFSLGRVTEGYGVVRFIKSRFEGPRTIVDIGSGNGGVRLALANFREFRVLSIDRKFNADFLAVRGSTKLRLHHVIADADALPLRSDAVDFITLLETLEHLRPPTQVGREIMRTLKSGGMCMLTTPARLRYLFKPDPHYGVRSLLLLPDQLQAWVARRLEIEGYDVTHTFWHVREIARFFPGEENIEVLWDKLPPFPDYLRTRLWWAFRNFLWSRLIFKKNDR